MPANKKEDLEEESNNHPEYDIYRLYQTYFENQQKLVFDFWSQIIKNVWWYNNKEK